MRYNLLRSPRPNRHAEWLVLRRISHSLPRGHGIPSSYTRLIGSDRHACAYNTVTERLPSSSYVWAVGGHPLQWGAATSGSRATHVQAVGWPSTAMGGSYLWMKRYSRTGCGGGGWASTPMGGSYLRIKHPPRTTSSGVRSPRGIILQSETPGRATYFHQESGLAT